MKTAFRIGIRTGLACIRYIKVTAKEMPETGWRTAAFDPLQPPAKRRLSAKALIRKAAIKDYDNDAC